MSPAIHQTQKKFFERLYRENYAWLYYWLLKNLKQCENAQDVVQDTFETVLNAQEITKIQHPKSFLAKVATRIIIDQSRRRTIEQAYIDYLSLQAMQHDLTTPENIILAVELLERIAKMLDGLDAQIRQIFLLRYIDGLTQLEIAEQLNISRRVVQLALIKALQHCDSIVSGSS